MVNAQEWLDINYPKEERSEVEEIYLTEPSLEGELDLSDFTYYLIKNVPFWGGGLAEYRYGIKVYIFSQMTDKVKFTTNDFSFSRHTINANLRLILPKEAKIIKLIDVQEWLDEWYPKNGTCIRKDDDGNNHREDYGKKREEITKLDIRYKYLGGELDLSDFINLKELFCEGNKLTSLNVSNRSQLTYLDCSNNKLTNLTLPTNPTNLRYLDLSNNNFSARDLSFLTPYTNLKELNISNTDLDSGLEYLPDSLKKFKCWGTKLEEENINNITLLKEWKENWAKNNPQEVLKLQEKRHKVNLTRLEKQIHELSLENTQLKEDVEIVISALGNSWKVWRSKN